MAADFSAIALEGPFHDTVGRVWARRVTVQFEASLVHWEYSAFTLARCRDTGVHGRQRRASRARCLSGTIAPAPDQCLGDRSAEIVQALPLNQVYGALKSAVRAIDLDPVVTIAYVVRLACWKWLGNQFKYNIDLRRPKSHASGACGRSWPEAGGH